MVSLSAVQAVTRLGGVARVRRVLRLTSRERLRTGLRRGELIRLSRGRVALPVADQALEQAAMVGGVASHLSAALHHGWQVKEAPELPTVTVPPGWDRSDVPERFLADLRVRRLPAGERDGWATSPLRTVLDCARDLPFDAALCVADSALRHGDLSAAQLAAGARGPRERTVAAYADGRAANPFESTLRALCVMIGLEVVPQYAVTWRG